MKIAIVGTVGVPARYGGFETLAEQLLNNVPPSECELVIYCQKSAYKDLTGVEADRFMGHRRIFMPLKANGPSSMLYDAISMFHAVLYEKVEILLVLGYSGSWVFPILRIFFPKIKIVTNIDGMEWRREKFGFFAKLLLKKLEWIAVSKSHVIVADNAALLPMVESTYPGVQPIEIAYGGDHTMVTPDEGGVVHGGYFLSIARIEPENNCEMILEAVKKVPECMLVFVGNWDVSDYGRELKRRFESVGNILLLDPVYDLSKLAAIRKNSCGYIHGHSVGGTNPSLVEAIFHTDRILAFDCVFNRATLNDCGAYFDGVAQLSRALREGVELVNEVDLFSLRERYEWGAVAERYVDVFNELRV